MGALPRVFVLTELSTVMQLLPALGPHTARLPVQSSGLVRSARCIARCLAPGRRSAARFTRSSSSSWTPSQRQNCTQHRPCTTAAATQSDMEVTTAAPAAFSKDEAKAKAVDMLDFINASWTPYHAVAEASTRLMKAGFQHIAEKDAWKLNPGEERYRLCGLSAARACSRGTLSKVWGAHSACVLWVKQCWQPLAATSYQSQQCGDD